MKQLGRLSLTCGEGRAYAPVRDHGPHLSLEGAWSPGGAVLYFTVGSASTFPLSPECEFVYQCTYIALFVGIMHLSHSASSVDVVVVYASSMLIFFQQIRKILEKAKAA